MSLWLRPMGSTSSPVAVAPVATQVWLWPSPSQLSTLLCKVTPVDVLLLGASLLDAMGGPEGTGEAGEELGGGGAQVQPRAGSFRGRMNTILWE